MRSATTFVGLSGGVDSAVAAALLRAAGRRVVGVFLDVGPLAPGCTSAHDRRAAAAVAGALGIPFRVLPCGDEYRRRILAPFLEGLTAGRTPNPDVECNRDLKFGLLLEAALQSGAAGIATGHYARLAPGRGQSPPYLRRGKDAGKDQSYFLARVAAARLRRVEFPIGHLRKSQVRRLARRFRLPSADRTESQGLCFLGPIDLPTYLATALAPPPGPIRDRIGQRRGFHRGLGAYTLGQRHGHGVGGGAPQFVVAKELPTNTLVVSDDPRDLERTAVTLTDVVVHPAVRLDRPLVAQVRYRQSPAAVAHIRERASTLTVTFAQPQRAATPGQLCALYDGDRLVAAGSIL